MTDPNATDTQDLIDRLRQNVQKTRDLVDDTARLLSQYATEKARREWVYADVKCGVDK